MRVITVRQPWAWAIVHGGKDVENRTRNIMGSYRGPVAIHAGVALAMEGFKDPTYQAARNAAGPVVRQVGLNRGSIVGVVDLVDVHVPDAFHGGHPFCWPGGWVTGNMCSPWAMDGHRHLELANPRAIDPIPAKGKLGLWRPDAELLAQIEAAL